MLSATSSKADLALAARSVGEVGVVAEAAGIVLQQALGLPQANLLLLQRLFRLLAHAFYQIFRIVDGAFSQTLERRTSGSSQ